MYFAIIRGYHFINLFNLSVSNSDPKGKKKILPAVSILLGTEKSVSVINYLFTITLTGKEGFSAQSHII